MINDTQKYWNQYHDIIDIPETWQDDRTRTCNICCIAMITGKNPNDILREMLDKYGINDQFQWEENLIGYLESSGYECFPITELAYPKPRYITIADFDKMCAIIDSGQIILYHKYGHYQLFIGYEDNEFSRCYIFNDPAGDRTLPLAMRTKNSGHCVRYSETFVLEEKIFGRCWVVKID